MNNETQPLRLTLTQTRAGIFFTPCNQTAKSLLPKGRKCFRSFEVTDLISNGHQIELNINPYLAVECWVKLIPVNVPSH